LIKRNMNDEDSLLFMDATHPHHQSIASYGWIKKGTEKHIKTTSAQQKLNIQGAIDIHSLKVISSFEPWLTEESSLDFLEKLRKSIPKGRIYLICDRAPYYHTERVKKYAKSMAIKIKFLPPYSPNLNPIERLWLYFQKQVIHNHYYPEFKEFTAASKMFFKNIRYHKSALRSLITDKFEMIPT